MNKPAKIRISYDSSNKNRYVESGSGKTYRCYGIATNDAAAKTLAKEVCEKLNSGIGY